MLRLITLFLMHDEKLMRRDLGFHIAHSKPQPYIVFKFVAKEPNKGHVTKSRVNKTFPHLLESTTQLVIWQWKGSILCSRFEMWQSGNQTLYNNLGFRVYFSLDMKATTISSSHHTWLQQTFFINGLNNKLGNFNNISQQFPNFIYCD